MQNDCSWLELFRVETKKGNQARRDGNEGMARVCARRAAGIVVKAYLRSKKKKIANSVLGNLRALRQADDEPEPIRASAGRFLLQITPEHILPGDIDLLVEVERLRSALFPGC